MRIEIPAYKLPSQNKLDKKNYRTYMTVRDEIQARVSKNIPKGIKPFETPVHIRIDAYYKHKHRRDSSNLTQKQIIDQLVKKKVIKDDDTRYVHDVTTRAHIGAQTDKVIINIKESNE